MRELKNRDDVEAVFEEPEAVLLKHGARCPISAAARDEVAAFERDYPDVPVFGVEVTGNRQLSDDLAERLGVEHESPQLFVLREGEPVWHANHFDITADAVAGRLGG